MLSHFDRDTALVQSAEGRFGGNISKDFWVQAGPNGGYLAAIAMRGAIAMVKDPARAPRSLHARYLSAPHAGAFELHAEIVREGRSMTTVAVRLQQDGRDFLHASACFSTGFSSVAFQDCAMPEALPVEQSRAVEKRIPLNGRFDMWHAIGGGERQSTRALSGGWIRFADQRPVDVLSLASMWDAWPPAVFARAMEQRYRGAVPTVEVSVYFRRRVPLPSSSASDYVLLKAESTMADEGITEESVEIWSHDGLLLAQSRQLALLL